MANGRAAAGEPRIAAEYDPRVGRANLQAVYAAGGTGLFLSCCLAWVEGPLFGGLVALAIAGVTGALALGWWGRHIRGRGCRVVLNGSARTLTFIRPPGYLPWRPARNRVIPLDRIRFIMGMRAFGSNRMPCLVIRGRDANGERVSFSICGDMNGFFELERALKAMCAEQWRTPWYEKPRVVCLVIIGFLAGVAVITVLGLFVGV